MNVLYFADTRFPIERANGVQTMATCLALAARGHLVTLVVRPDTAAIARDPFEFYGWPRAAGVTIRTIAAGEGARSRRLRFLLSAAAIVRAMPDAVVYTRDLGLASFLLQWPGSRRPALVYESHGLAPIVAAEMPHLLGKPGLTPTDRKLRRLDRREQRVWSRASAYVTITRALEDELSARYGPRPRVFVVPDGADAPADDKPSPADDRPESIPRQRTESPSQLLAAYSGHLYPWKGVDVFIHALALAPSMSGLIVGGHPEEADRARVESLAQSLGVSARLEISGLVRREDVSRWLSRADMLILPNTASAISERYTSPLKLFEYLWMGRPIIASDLPALREVLPDDAAVFVPPGDPAALAAAMTALASDRARATALGQAALAIAPNYSWAARGHRLDAVLEAAVAAHP